jgi:hypothetical protein
VAQSLYARAAARGYPVYDIGGQTGQGALPDSTAPPQVVGQQRGTWSDPNADPGYVPEGLAPPQGFEDDSFWGGLSLPASANPDNTPRGHGAPMADPTLPVGDYYAEADATHAATFTGPAVRRDVGTVTAMRTSRDLAEGNGASNQQPLTGPIRGQAGLDAVQGYGGGGPGPGGTNLPELTVEQRDYAGETYKTFVSAAEVPFISVSADQFIPADQALGPWPGGGFDVPTFNVAAQETIGADVPAQGAPLAAAGASAGFWG